MGSRNPSMECVVNTEPALSFLQFTFIQYLTFCYCALNKIRFKLWNSVQLFAKKLLKESSILWSIYFMKFTNDMMFYLMDIVCGSLCTIGESKDPQKNLLTFDSLFDVKWEHRAAVWKLICNNHKDKYQYLSKI